MNDDLLKSINDALEALGPDKPLVVWVNKMSAPRARDVWGQCVLLQVWDGKYDFPDYMTRKGTLFLAGKTA